MEAAAATAATATAAKNPRVGVAVFVVDDRNYILIGKRKGSNGAGTLALPGGHLEWQETFEGCAEREVLEETGIDLRQASASSPSSSSPTSYLTLMNVRHLKDPHDTDEGKHYVTIFMKSRITRAAGQEEIPAHVLEPTKCDGWTWVPLNYLFSRHEAQAAMERYASSAAAQGESLGVPLDRLLLAQRLGERISGSAGNASSGDAGAMAAEQAPASASATDEEMAAYALADDLAQGATLFRPLGDLLRTQGDLLHAEFGRAARATETDKESAAATASAPQLPSSSGFSSDATAIINDALRAPPHLKHALTLSIPAPTPHIADQIAAILRVDKPLRPYDTTITYTTTSTTVRVEIKASTVRLLRLSINAVLEDVSLVVRTMEAFPGPLRAHEVDARGEGGVQGNDVFEEGTVGVVEQVTALKLS